LEREAMNKQERRGDVQKTKADGILLHQKRRRRTRTRRTVPWKGNPNVKMLRLIIKNF
jgi:hypothetical protein